MRTQIKEQFKILLQEDYPEVILLFTENGSLQQYLEDRITTIDPLIDELLQEDMTNEEVITLCMEQLIAGFGPSKYKYLSEVMQREFPEEYEQFNHAGVLKFEVTNLIVACMAAFDAFEFSLDNLDDTFLRHMIIAEMHDYLISRTQN